MLQYYDLGRNSGKIDLPKHHSPIKNRHSSTVGKVLIFKLNKRPLNGIRNSNHVSTGCPKSHAPSLTRYIFGYENSIAIKEVCVDRATLHNFADTKHDPIDDLVTYLSKLKWISSKYTKTY